jgi:hypothetical protein
MVQRLFATLLATVLFLTLSTFALAQEAAKQGMKKVEMALGPLRSVS